MVGEKHVVTYETTTSFRKRGVPSLIDPREETPPIQSRQELAAIISHGNQNGEFGYSNAHYRGCGRDTPPDGLYSKYGKPTTFYEFVSLLNLFCSVFPRSRSVEDPSRDGGVGSFGETHSYTWALAKVSRDFLHKRRKSLPNYYR